MNNMHFHFWGENEWEFSCSHITSHLFQHATVHYPNVPAQPRSQSWTHPSSSSSSSSLFAFFHHHEHWNNTHPSLCLQTVVKNVGFIWVPLVCFFSLIFSSIHGCAPLLPRSSVWQCCRRSPFLSYWWSSHATTYKTMTKCYLTDFIRFNNSK